MHDFVWAVLLACVLLRAASAGETTQLDGHRWYPADVWRGYDPSALPLDVEVVRSWEEEGISFQKLYFTGEIVDGVKVRVLALTGAPTRASHLPGVLHIHGGGQTASLDWVRYWAKRGYVGVSFDYCGPWASRTEFTDWAAVKQANMAQANGVYQVTPTPRESSWYHWAVASRRALTLLERHPSVDPKRLGMFGVSMGGTLCWMVAGSDRRVKTAVPIYGCGYNVDPRKTRLGLPEPSSGQLLYKQALSPEAHAPCIRCPILFLSATNDHHGWMDDAFEALGAVDGVTRQAFTPRYIHHIEPDQGRDLAMWMDWHLKGGKPWPRTPGLRVTVDHAGMLRAGVHPDEAGQVRRVDVYYSLGDRIPPNRFWRRVAPAKDGGTSWAAALPVTDPWQAVYAFANVIYEDGMCLSSPLAHVMPGQIGKARAQLNPSTEIDSGPGFEHWYFGPAYTDPNIDSTYLRTGDDGGPYLTVNPEMWGERIDFVLASHAIGDPQFAGQPGIALSFEVKGGFDTGGLTVSVCEQEWTIHFVTYAAKVSQADVTGGWRTVILPLSAFGSAAGAHAPAWSRMEKLVLHGVAARAAPPCFRRFRWVPEDAAQAPGQQKGGSE